MNGHVGMKTKKAQKQDWVEGTCKEYPNETLTMRVHLT